LFSVTSTWSFQGRHTMDVSLVVEAMVVDDLNSCSMRWIKTIKTANKLELLFSNKSRSWLNCLQSSLFSICRLSIKNHNSLDCLTTWDNVSFLVVFLAFHIRNYFNPKGIGFWSGVAWENFVDMQIGELLLVLFLYKYFWILIVYPSC